MVRIWSSEVPPLSARICCMRRRVLIQSSTKLHPRQQQDKDRMPHSIQIGKQRILRKTEFNGHQIHCPRQSLASLGSHLIFPQETRCDWMFRQEEWIANHSGALSLRSSCFHRRRKNWSKEDLRSFSEAGNRLCFDPEEKTWVRNHSVDEVTKDSKQEMLISLPGTEYSSANWREVCSEIC